MSTPPTPSPVPPALAGQRALITGAARRVGAEIARTLHAAGAQVVIHCHRSEREARELAAALESLRPASAAVVSGDLLDVPALPALVERASACFGGIDVLINNASSFYPTPLGQISLAQWDDLIGTNLRAPLFLVQAAASRLRERGGSVINLIDIHATRPLRDHSVYCTAKAGLAMLTRSLARELAPAIRVNAISPGAVLWPDAPMSPERRARILEQTPLARAGSPADIARTALFLTAYAPYITGQIIAVDGGRSLAW